NLHSFPTRRSSDLDPPSVECSMMNPSSFDDTSVQVTSTAELPTGRADVANGVSGGCRTATQVTDHDTSAVAPRTTATVRGFVSAAVQFGASPLSATEWSPG